MSASDIELTALVVATGDQHAFGQLVERYQTLVRAMLTRMTGNHALADDLAQDAFIKAYRKIGTFSGKGSFKSWLCRIAYTEFLQAIRKRKAASAAMERFKVHQEIEERSDNWEQGDAMDLDRALGHLSEVERTAIVLCFSSGMSHSEVSDVMDLPLGTVKSHINRGKAKMRTLLEEKEAVKV
ncbi:MAG: RNA polymerase subunit sigma-70 [Robiginitomaculum sp.]|nr:MAG: RNA polymerase subunit sigma-70 [Robiginitomaculum sp.]